MHRLPKFLVALLLATSALGGCSTVTDTSDLYSPVVDVLQLSELAQTYTEAQVGGVLDGQLENAPDAERRSAAILVSSGIIDASDLGNPERASATLADYQAIVSDKHPDLVGRIGDATLLQRLNRALSYDKLLSADEMLEVLGGALSDGVITGYDLRRSGVYDNFPAAQTFIYSHSDPVHLRQLVTVLDREGVDAWVYVTPKVSAFLHREEWGTPGPNVVTLAGGANVVQGQEMAVLFRFSSPGDRARFDDVVNRYAKRDSDDEQGLIAGAWWQPFYYTDRDFPKFQEISLIVLTAGEYEATLTVLAERAQSVIDAVNDAGWRVRHDKVRVNPAFYRFLEGGYK